MQKYLWRKKVWPSKVESYMKVKFNAWRGRWQQDLISACGQGLTYWVDEYYTGHIRTIASLVVVELTLLSLCKIITIVNQENINNSPIAAVYIDNHLWDGEGSSAGDKLLFTGRNILAEINEPIIVRICHDQSYANEDILITNLKL